MYFTAAHRSECNKTTLIGLLTDLCRLGQCFDDSTGPALFRPTDTSEVTILVDEADGLDFGSLASILIVASLTTDTLLENIYANLEANPFGEAMLTREAEVSVPQGSGARRP